ncbi:AGE family epimerase/isomerase [Vibrio nigripulchritudo]|uniref:AGE family epimerase/isomerase n=1 Tax=Vibrio nigripulchritudo TaxID=28173 RepID=UPI0003B216BA|nr:AGE family epimerase/isomerase [Vibrio nigripulchritudo]CCN71762.1 putative N-acyl-D-glucosamine 2-epimerase [Vibrio nigripulchritudo SFn118]
MTMTKDYRSEAFLTSHIQSLIDFYHPECIDRERGGYINQFKDDGTIFDADTKHLVGTCRFAFNYSLAYLITGKQEYQDAAEHGIRFLLEYHKQQDGGYAWVLNGLDVEDGTRHCYGHAFVLLAAAASIKADAPSGRTLLNDIWEVLEVRFWDKDAQLYVDEILEGSWSNVSEYRGQNANMHMCEAMICAYEATKEARFLDRAYTLAKRVCVELASKADGLVWEHYDQNWQHDWEYNLDDPKHLFRPWGYLPGHFTEWSKLLLILSRYRREEWMIETAAHLFNTALDVSWDPSTDGMNYTFSPDRQVVDTDRYYWVTAETIAASAALAVETGEDKYWDWYDTMWSVAERHFIDHQYGGWYRVLDTDNKRYDDLKSPPSKTDYHPLSACFEVLQSLKQL